MLTAKELLDSGIFKTNHRMRTAIRYVCNMQNRLGVALGLNDKKKIYVVREADGSIKLPKLTFSVRRERTYASTPVELEMFTIYTGVMDDLKKAYVSVQIDRNDLVEIDGIVDIGVNIIKQWMMEVGLEKYIDQIEVTGCRTNTTFVFLPIESVYEHIKITQITDTTFMAYLHGQRIADGGYTEAENCPNGVAINSIDACCYERHIWVDATTNPDTEGNELIAHIAKLAGEARGKLSNVVGDMAAAIEPLFDYRGLGNSWVNGAAGEHDNIQFTPSLLHDFNGMRHYIEYRPELIVQLSNQLTFTDDVAPVWVNITDREQPPVIGGLYKDWLIVSCRAVTSYAEDKLIEPNGLFDLARVAASLVTNRSCYGVSTATLNAKHAQAMHERK